MKIAMKKTVIASLLLTSVALTACSGSNPLESQSKADSKAFVVEASKVAEQQLHVKAYPPGSTYYECMADDGMVDKRSNPHICEDVYNAMIAYARTTNGEFKNISLDDLTDQKAFKPLYNIPQS